MSATRTSLVAVSMAAVAVLLTGCGGGADYGLPGAKSPGYGPSAPPASYDSPSPASAPEPAPAPMARGEGRARMDEASPSARPGLGTEWGETRYSSISRVSFERADWSSPFASLALFYNDREGANAMASVHRAWTSSFDVGGGLVTVDLRDESGSPYRGFVSGGRAHVIGEAGHRYTIVLRNHTSYRFEVVLSVDGLDVMDGRSASFEKRGYLVDPHGVLEVDGFRQSTETVAAFRFGSVRDSYANQKHGDTRNVGVIGVALFHERGLPVPVWSAGEVQRRRDANPFPGTFATPPGM